MRTTRSHGWLSLLMVAGLACGGSNGTGTSSTGGDASATDSDLALWDLTPADVTVEPDSPDQTPVTGRSCATAADCGQGYDCYTQAPGGYCMPGAPGGPTACRDPEDPCPTGTTCSPLPWHEISGVCLLPCETAADCREGYRCGIVELFPGEAGTPHSAGPVCWTACQVGADQSCNDNPETSSIRGTCQADGTCACNPGSELNPETGRCL